MNTLKKLTKEEFDTLEFVRVETYRNYFYGLARLPSGMHATVSSYRGTEYTMQEIPTIDEEIALKQELLPFVDSHAVIHISPKKNIWRWLLDD